MANSIVQSIICRQKEVLHLIFPPLCLSCKEGRAEKWFCSACWEQCSLADPLERCRHCFAEEERLLCAQCRRDPILCFPRAYLFDRTLPASILLSKIEGIEKTLAACAFVFWTKLTEDVPDAILAVPDEGGKKSIFRIAKELACFFQRPYVRGLKRSYQAFLKPTLLCISSAPSSFRHVLALDSASSLSWLEKASTKMAEMFPRKLTIISLFNKDSP